MSDTAPKKVGVPLALGVLFIPHIFTWFLLKVGYSKAARILGFSWLGVATLVIILDDSGSRSKEPESAPSVAAPATSVPISPVPSSSTKAVPPKVPVPAQKKLPIADDTAKLAEIERRFQTNTESLRSHYGSSEQLTQLQKDIIQLAMLKAEYLDIGKSADEKALGKKANELGAKVEIQSRQVYASMLEEGFMKTGIDVRVSAAGSRKDQLRIDYTLMSQPLVYRFQNELGLDEKAASFGFRNIVYSNGFKSDLGRKWTVNLKN